MIENTGHGFSSGVSGAKVTCDRCGVELMTIEIDTVARVREALAPYMASQAAGRDLLCYNCRHGKQEPYR